MRVRTDERRRSILDAAWKVFRNNGYERTTMSDISEMVGGSKATLYGYFQSKEQLFEATLEEVIGAHSEAIFSALSSEGELQARLLAFAQSYLKTRLSADSLAVERALISEGDRSDLGERLRLRFVQPQWRRFTSLLDREMQAGRLRRTDPILATWHYRGLIEADLVERRLHGDTTVTVHEIETAAVAGVDAFLRAYAS